MSVSPRIKQARNTCGFSQAELASLIGVSQSAVGNYESEVDYPKESINFRLPSVLEVDANFLFQNEMRGGSAKVALSQTQTGYAQDYIWGTLILDAYQIADESTRRAACTVLKIEHVAPTITRKSGMPLNPCR